MGTAQVRNAASAVKAKPASQNITNDTQKNKRRANGWNLCQYYQYESFKNVISSINIQGHWT